MISLLIPSKKRINNLKETLKNISYKTNNYNNIEILIAIDNDDIESQLNKEFIIKHFKHLNIQIHSREHSDYLNAHYYNWLAEKASGKYLWAIGDDVQFNSKNWDLILEEKIEEYLKDKSDRLAYIQVSEDNTKAKHPCFPLITRECFDLTHMYFHPQLLSWGADRCLYEIYSHNDIRRVLGIPKVHIEHLSYHDGKGVMDETAKSMKERFFRDPSCHNQVSMYIVPQNINFIKNYIEKKYYEEKIKREKDMI